MQISNTINLVVIVLLIYGGMKVYPSILEAINKFSGGGPIPDATTCAGIRCAKEGQFCPPTATGSRAAGYCCINKQWTPGACPEKE